MVDAVNIVQNSTPPVRSVPQGNLGSNGGSVESAKASQDFTVSSFRIDSGLDLVILEFKSAETGDVVRQYPTERQIRTIQRVAQLEGNKEEAQAVQTDITTVSPTFEGSSGGSRAASAPTVTVSAPSAPTTSATSVNTTQGTTASVSDSSSVSSSSASSSTQSVTV